jgi:tetratricopeptide (TPR) repeat protein
MLSMGTIDWKKKLNWTSDQLQDLRNAGYSYIRQGKYEIALPFFEALVVLDSESAYDIQTLGALYLQLNNPAKALKCFDKALKLNAEHAVTLLNITKALFALGKKEEGIKLANILKNEPNPAISNVAKAFLLAFS